MYAQIFDPLQVIKQQHLKRKKNGLTKRKGHKEKRSERSKLSRQFGQFAITFNQFYKSLKTFVDSPAIFEHKILTHNLTIFSLITSRDYFSSIPLATLRVDYYDRISSTTAADKLCNMINNRIYRCNIWITKRKCPRWCATWSH